VTAVRNVAVIVVQPAAPALIAPAGRLLVVVVIIPPPEPDAQNDGNENHDDYGRDADH
jgi:hypothetical protein